MIVNHVTEAVAQARLWEKKKTLDKIRVHRGGLRQNIENETVAVTLLMSYSLFP